MPYIGVLGYESRERQPSDVPRPCPAERRQRQYRPASSCPADLGCVRQRVVQPNRRGALFQQEALQAHPQRHWLTTNGICEKEMEVATR